MTMCHHYRCDVPKGSNSRYFCVPAKPDLSLRNPKFLKLGLSIHPTSPFSLVARCPKSPPGSTSPSGSACWRSHGPRAHGPSQGAWHRRVLTWTHQLTGTSSSPPSQLVSTVFGVASTFLMEEEVDITIGHEDGRRFETETTCWVE